MCYPEFRSVEKVSGLQIPAAVRHVQAPPLPIPTDDRRQDSSSTEPAPPHRDPVTTSVSLGRTHAHAAKVKMSLVCVEKEAERGGQGRSECRHECRSFLCCRCGGAGADMGVADEEGRAFKREGNGKATNNQTSAEGMKSQVLTG